MSLVQEVGARGGCTEALAYLLGRSREPKQALHKSYIRENHLYLCMFICVYVVIRCQGIFIRGGGGKRDNCPVKGGEDYGDITTVWYRILC